MSMKREDRALFPYALFCGLCLFVCSFLTGWMSYTLMRENAPDTLPAWYISKELREAPRAPRAPHAPHWLQASVRPPILGAGRQFQSGGNFVALLSGCADNELIKADGTTGELQCEDDVTVSDAGVITSAGLSADAASGADLTVAGGQTNVQPIAVTSWGAGTGQGICIAGSGVACTVEFDDRDRLAATNVSGIRFNAANKALDDRAHIWDFAQSSQDATDVSLRVSGQQSQTGDLIQLRDNPTDNNIVFRVSPSGGVRSIENAGTVGTNVTAEEYGDGVHHTTILTLASVDYTIGDNAAAADNSLLYTFPDGEIIIERCSMSLGLTLTAGTPTTDTPEACLGTTAASGVNATCGDVAATTENLLVEGSTNTLADVAGTVLTTTVLGTTGSNDGFIIADADAHTLYLNFADTWADVDDTAATASGTVTCAWTWLGDPA